MPMPLTIHPLSRHDMALALDWAAREGWNPGLEDAEAFHVADPEGFLVGRVAGTPVSLISAVRYPPDFGFIGFYIVHPDWRGRGYGWATWQRAMQHLAGRNIALDGVLAEQDNYRRSGFALAWRNVRYAGRTGAGAATGDAELVDLKSPGPVTPAPLAAYDAHFFPADRRAFLAAWVTRPGSHALGLLRDGRLAGYGVIRPCRTGFKLAPLFADRPDDAERLFQALQARVPAGQPLFLDVPEPHAEAVALAVRHAMTPCFETARMYTGPVPDIALARTYGITSFELG